jgi:heme exporter protein D
MMPDLGKYAAYVWSAYGATAVILAALLWMTLRAHWRVKRDLAGLETEFGRPRRRSGQEAARDE